MYLLRASPIWKFPDRIEHMDATLKDTLEKILNLSLDNLSWTQATLPIRHGGIGVRQISSVALPAFLASVHTAERLCARILACDTVSIACSTEAVESWKAICINDDIPKEINQQKLWDVPLIQITQQFLSENFTSDRDRARLLALRQKESGDWLHALPSANLGTLLDSESFRIAVGLRLGAPVCVEHRCPCGAEVDRSGVHGLSCQKSAGRFSRHGSLNDIIKRSLATINIPSVLEPTGVFRDDGKRPDGMTLIPWERGRPLVWDATCGDTLAPSHVRESASAAGAVAEKADLGKRRKYVNLSHNYIFVPFSVETLGPWSSSAKKFFNKITPRLVTSSGDKRAGAFLAQKVGLAIQRGNAASILATIPRGQGFFD